MRTGSRVWCKLKHLSLTESNSLNKALNAQNVISATSQAFKQDVVWWWRSAVSRFYTVLMHKWNILPCIWKWDCAFVCNWGDSTLFSTHPFIVEVVLCLSAATYIFNVVQRSAPPDSCAQQDVQSEQFEVCPLWSEGTYDQTGANYPSTLPSADTHTLPHTNPSSWTEASRERSSEMTLHQNTHTHTLSRGVVLSGPSAQEDGARRGFSRPVRRVEAQRIARALALSFSGSHCAQKVLAEEDCGAEILSFYLQNPFPPDRH